MKNSSSSPEEQLRLRAEAQIKKKKDKTYSPASPADLQKTVHELEVHQIELEMQNEELQEARLNLESMLNQYTDLYDFAPVGYFTLDVNGSILNVNLTGASMVGIERSVLLNRPFGTFVSPEDRPALNTFLETVFDSNCSENCELAIVREDKELLFVLIEARALDPIPQCRIAVIDITEQTLTERKLRESEQLFHSLFETMTQGIVFLDSSHRIISINPAFADMLNLSAELIKGTVWPVPGWRVIHEDGTVFRHGEQPAETAFRSNRIVKNLVMGIISPKVSGCAWLRINAIPQHTFNNSVPCQVILIIEDITDIKRMASYNMLTKREKEVFLLLARNLGRQTIADTLRIKPKTVDKHRENLMEKLSIYDIDAIILFAKLVGVIKS